MDSLEVPFETYIIINDEEYKVEVTAIGDLCNDSFSHEFGVQNVRSITNVFITRIVNLENDEVINYKALEKEQKKMLLDLAYDYLDEQENNWVENDL